MALLLLPPSSLLQVLSHLLSGLADPWSLVLDSVCVWRSPRELRLAIGGRGAGEGWGGLQKPQEFILLQCWVREAVRIQRPGF